MWRPDDWEDNRKFYEDGKYSGKPNTIYDFDASSYEAGADAMLEALRKMAFITFQTPRGTGGATGGDTITLELAPELKEFVKSARVLFIPDD